MTSVDLYRWTLVLPLAVPVVVSIAATAFQGLSPLAFLLLYSLRLAGGAYLLLGGGLLVWTHGRPEAEVRRAFNLAPLLMLPLAWIWIAPRFLSFGDIAGVLLDPRNWLDSFVLGLSGYVLAFGYGYVLLSHGAVGIAKRAGWVASVRPPYRGDGGGEPPRLRPGDLADQLERLLGATGWTEREVAGRLELLPIGEPALDEIRTEAMRLSLENVALGGETYFSPRQRPVVEGWIEELRAMEAPTR